MAVTGISAARASARAAPPPPPAPSPPSSARRPQTPAPSPPSSSRAPSRRQSAPDLLSPSPSASARPSPRPPLPAPPNPPPDPDDDLDALVPSVFSWNYGGQAVYIAGAWDAWASKTPLYKNGTEFIALLYVPVGEFQCKYYVDDNWQCAPNLPTRTDEHGNTNNVITISRKPPEFDSAAPLDERRPLSPLASYRQNASGDFAADPPALPPHLEARSLKPLPDDISPTVRASAPRNPAPHDGAPGNASGKRPFFSHVYIDHLYQARMDPDDDDLQSLSQSTRIGNKVVNTVFVTTRLPRSDHTNEGNGFGHQPPS